MNFFCDCFCLRNVPHLASRGTVPVSNFQQLPDRKKPPQLTLCWKLAGGQLVFQPFFFVAAPIHFEDTN